MNRTVLAVSGIFLGLLLSLLLIIASTSTTKRPEIPDQITTRNTQKPTKVTSQDLSRNNSPAPNTPLATTESPTPSNPQEVQQPKPNPEPSANPNPAYQDAVEVLDVPEVHKAVQANSRWGQIIFQIRDQNDPKSMDLKREVKELRRELVEVRRSPQDFDFRDLEERQRHILSELRQTPGWTPASEKAAQRLESVLNAQ